VSIKEIGREVKIFLFDLCFGLFILFSFWLFVVSFGRVDLIEQFINEDY